MDIDYIFSTTTIVLNLKSSTAKTIKKKKNYLQEVLQNSQPDKEALLKQNLMLVMYSIQILESTLDRNIIFLFLCV